MRLKCKGLLKSFLGDINMFFPKFCIFMVKGYGKLL